MGREVDDDELENAMIELDAKCEHVVHLQRQQIFSCALCVYLRVLVCFRSGDGSVDFEEFADWFWKEAPEEERKRLIVVYYENVAGEPAETTMAELPQLLLDGVVTQETRVWVDGMDDWAELSVSGKLRAIVFDYGNNCCVRARQHASATTPTLAVAVGSAQSKKLETTAELRRAILKKIWHSAFDGEDESKDLLGDQQVLRVLELIRELDPQDSVRIHCYSRFYQLLSS
jgi:hypothetical protein